MLTIFTPTFNRRHLLVKVYDSLCQQTNTNFHWLIIDDGSSDDTCSLVELWKKENRINIDYHYQSNGGKMRAHNKAVKYADTELFICVDSDDYLLPDAVNNILSTWEQLESVAIKEHLAGIVAYKSFDSIHPMNNSLFPNCKVSTLGNLYAQGFKGETTLIYRTDILKQFLFPEIDGEKFIPEAVVYDKIDLKYQLYLLPKILTICEYQPHGLSDSIKQLRRKNPKGYLLYYQIKVEVTPISILRYKYIAYAICFAWYLHNNIFKVIPATVPEIFFGIPVALLLNIYRKF